MRYTGSGVYEEDLMSGNEYAYDFNNPTKVVNVNDRHVREVYRIPTPPPQHRQVFHRAPAPQPKIIERVFVHRPAPEIIENIIQVPPQEVRVINKTKYLPKTKPIIRTQVVHLQSSDVVQPQHTYVSVEQYSPTTLVYPSQSIQYIPSYVQPIYRSYVTVNTPLYVYPQYTFDPWYTYTPIILI